MIDLLAMLVAIFFIGGFVVIQARKIAQLVEWLGKLIAKLILRVCAWRAIRQHPMLTQSYELRNARLVLDEHNRLLEKEIDDFYKVNNEWS